MQEAGEARVYWMGNKFSHFPHKKKILFWELTVCWCYYFSFQKQQFFMQQQNSIIRHTIYRSINRRNRRKKPEIESNQIKPKDIKPSIRINKMKFVVLVSLLLCRVCCVVDMVRSLSTKPTRPEHQKPQSQHQPRHHPEPKAIPSSSAVSSASTAAAVSLLANKKLKIQLDIGRLSTTTAGTAGNMMPQQQQSLRPGWAESGAHLVLDATVEFSTVVLDDQKADNADVYPRLARDGEIRRHDRGILRVNYDDSPHSPPPNHDATLPSESSSSSKKRPSTFISIEHGVENVDFSDGGWYSILVLFT